MDKPIRILQIVPNMQMGGLETFIMNIYRNIDKEKIQIDFLVHYEEKKFFDDEIEKLGGNIYRFSLRNNNNIIKYIKELNKFYKEHKEYKVVHCHMSSIGFINFLVAKKNGIKVRIAHSHNNLTDKTLKGKLKKIMMLPYKYVSTINFACSKSAGDFLYGNRTYEIIPNAIEIKKFQYDDYKRKMKRKQLNIDDNVFVVGHIGRFNIQKNHIFIVDIFKKILERDENSKLILVGDGELKEKIKQIVQTEKIEEKVVFLGNQNNIEELYQVFDAFLFPSLFEGLGITLIEAQISGLKCFTSSRVVASEAKITENLYFLDLNNDADYWAKKILKYKKYNRNSHITEAVKYGFDIKQLTKKLEKKYIELYMSYERG